MRGGTTEKMSINPEDEYMHPGCPDPTWWENYHFNGYDPEKEMGITIFTGLRPALGVRTEIITVYSDGPSFFFRETQSEGNALVSGSLKMEPVTLLKKWRVRMKDTFSKESENEEVEFDLNFESDIPPYAFRTQRGDRYEQPGILKGKIHINGKTTDINGKGIRDHSWEIRTISSWGRWYAFMGYCGEYPLSIASINVNGMSYFHGWLRKREYEDVTDLEVNPVFSGDILETCSIVVKTAEDTLELKAMLVSCVEIPPIGEQDRSKVRETLVTLDNGYGILWYGS